MDRNTYQREYHRKNADKLNERRRNRTTKQRARVNESKRKLRLRNLEKIREQERASHHRNKENKKQANKIWRSKNAAAIRKRTREWNLDNRENSRYRKVEKLYGLSKGEYKALMDERNGLCGICGQPEIQIDKRTGELRRLAVDHDHKTDKVRGLLCARCNMAIGLFRDDVEVMRLAIAYLESWVLGS